MSNCLLVVMGKTPTDRKQDCESQLLKAVAKKYPATLDSSEFARENRFDHDLEVVGMLLSLQAASMIRSTAISHTSVSLTEDGERVISSGSPEVLVFNMVKVAPVLRDTILQRLKMDGRNGLAQAMRKKWIAMKDGVVTALVDEVYDSVQRDLLLLRDNAPLDVNITNDLRKRKLVKLAKYKTFCISKGDSFALERTEFHTEINMKMLKEGTWKDSSFKNVNLKALGKDLDVGTLHPLLKVRHQFRSILLEMGFEEMPTNRFVENSFWNFDSLFQPQQHPARDAHDTFFLEAPSVSKGIPSGYVESVKSMHEVGGMGSIGWRYDWKVSEALKNIMRTHTTAVSSRMLHQLAQQGDFTPKKYFSIDRVFRNESVDATHLAEFHQVEGLVADYNLTLGDLLGTIKVFFQRIGIENVKFKPAYNPYTEPSMEIFGYSNELKEWIEIGNSGIFRPEMLLPMGLPPDVRVIAWGLSLERPTMITYNIGDIRSLSGHTVDLKVVKDNPICRFE